MKKRSGRRRQSVWRMDRMRQKYGKQEEEEEGGDKRPRKKNLELEPKKTQMI